MRKEVGADGLTPCAPSETSASQGLPAELTAWRDRKLAAGELSRSASRAGGAAGGAGRGRTAARGPARRPRAATWQPLETTTDEEATFSRRSTRSARAAEPEPLRVRVRLGGYKPASTAMGLLHAPHPLGRSARRAIRQQVGSPTARSSSSACGWRTKPWPPTVPSGDALVRGVTRLMTFLDARAIDASAVQQRDGCGRPSRLWPNISRCNERPGRSGGVRSKKLPG